MTIAEYLSHVNTLYITGNAREHSYRGDLQTLISTILPDILVTNEPAKVSCGAPDYMLTRKGIPVGYIEAKDIGIDLNSKNLKEQFERYKAGLNNLIITDYLNFKFYRDGEFITEISIASLKDGQIKPLPENFKAFTNLISDFALVVTQSIKSPTRLAKMMAGKARLMADVIEKSLDRDDKNERRSYLKLQMISFKQMLIHDITNRSFADIYSQTIAYGMFAARYHDPTLPTFSRMEAAQLIPKSNPFLRKLFQDIAGFDLDDRLVWIVEELVSIFLASDVSKILKNFGKSTKQEDPVVHFYETFLGEYNPALRKARGVWYTPQPVVNFLVRAVDDILKEEFNLPQGLADTSKTRIKLKSFSKATADMRSKVQEVETDVEVHRVQILDPATGTGTFLSEVVRQIYQKFQGQQGIWTRYVTEHVIPRLNGFELLMASYAMAHLKMDMLLTETGYKPNDNQRFRIFLTNSLEEAHPDTGTLFSSWLSDEADQANAIKKDTPVMCVIGNPPYSIASSNLSDKQRKAIERYKSINGIRIKEKGALQLEKNLNDDYVKFIAFGEDLIRKNGEGVLAFINNNNFLDAITLRGMRWNLLETFDLIYIIDAHGNYMKKEISPDGSRDENLFDIQQGVSINIFIKKNNKKKISQAQVKHFDLFGKRTFKYKFLEKNSIETIDWSEIKMIQDKFYFVPKNYETADEYFSGIALDKLFELNVTGVKTHRDKFIIGPSKGEISERVKRFYDLTSTIEITKAKLGLKDTGTWNAEKARLKGIFDNKYFEKIHYRPFDNLAIYFDENLIDNTRIEVMQHFIGKKENLGLIIPRQAVTDNWSHVQVSDLMIDNRVHYSNKGTPIFCPLYLYPEISEQQTIDNQQQSRNPNLKPEILSKIEERLQLTFVSEKETDGNVGNVCIANSEEDRNGFQTTFSPVDLLDYIYAVLHSPEYREKFKEFLKIDFPRVPYPQDSEKFWQLVTLGGELRQLHLLESPLVEKYITSYPEDGDNVITRKITKNSPGYDPVSETHGKVWINNQQYFDKVPLVAWEFYIGGYQPAQKWLKDRKGRELSFEEILHYQKIIVVLNETDRVMKEIDKILVLEKIKEI